MWSFKEIIKTSISLDSVYRARKTPLWITLIFFLLINVGFSFPFTFNMLKLEQMSVANFIEPAILEKAEADNSLFFLEEVVMQAGVLSIENANQEEIVAMKNSVIDIGTFKIRFDYDDLDESSTDSNVYAVRLTKNYMEMNLGVPMVTLYNTFEDVELKDLTHLERLDYFFVNGLRSTIKQWILPLGLFFYFAFLSINTVFVLGMSVLAILFRIGDKVKLTYKESLNMVVYASVIPIVISVVLSFMFNALGLNMIIYNFGTLGIYMLVRKKYLKNPKLKPENT